MMESTSPDEATPVSMREVFEAQRRIQGVARHTPLQRSATLTSAAGTDVFLKLETTQDTGAFKIRGAANKILNLTEQQKARGVVTASTGNHGRAVAYVCKKVGIKATVCLSERVPDNKVEALRQLGAEVVIQGRSQDDAEVRSYELQDERGLTMIHPFDDPQVIGGQGTIGLELLQDLPEIDTVVVPLSGGGLIGGIGLALKAADPAIRVIGVSMERAPVMVESLRAGKPVRMPEEGTLADSLQGGIGLDNQYTFRLVQSVVDELVLVSEEEIAEAMVFALHQERLVVEGGGAVGIAALLQGKIPALGSKAAVIISGNNVDVHQLLSLAKTYS